MLHLFADTTSGKPLSVLQILRTFFHRGFLGFRKGAHIFLEEKMEKNELHDVSILTLKRWNLPQTQSVIRPSGGSLGEYVSFQSHHFVDIHPVANSSIPEAYNKIAELRHRQQDSNDSDVHIVQCITILGRDKSFWEQKPNVLYTTFLQLSNAADRDFSKLEQAIGEIIRECGDQEEGQWALYYALDFCDLILFTKDMDLDVYHNILWRLALVRDGVLKGIRDTFTLFGFHRDFLRTAFCCIDQNQPFDWTASMALSVSLSIQSLTTWTALKKKLDDAKIRYDPRRTSGRYDLNLITPTLSGPQVLKVLRYIDELCTNQVDTVFGGYEIHFLAQPWDSASVPNDATQDREFEKAAGKLMKALCNRYGEIHADSTNYANETYRSLKALLKNGFSEEFVLSVFVSFCTFLNTALVVDSGETDKRILKNLDRMNRDYFSALNTLALCTMHSERQFIQAPAFHATYFDVPPKLLAFYSAAAFQIVETLWDGQEPKYRFLITPDFKQDIYVRSLVVNEACQTKERLAVIYLCEKYFYRPADALALLCHEIGHYMSDRQRELRCEGIFYLVSLSLLARTPLIEIALESGEVPESDSLFHVMAHSLGDALKAVFNEYFSNNPEYQQTPFHLLHVTRFLKQQSYGVDLFKSAAQRDKVSDQWQQSLSQAAQGKPSLNKEIESALAYVEKSLDTDYLTVNYTGGNAGARQQVLSILARNVIINVQALFEHPKSIESHCKYCENIIQAYSETYADMRMAQLMGNLFSLEQYEDLLRIISSKDIVLCDLRHDALCRTLFGTNNRPNVTGESQIKQILLEASVNHIHHYLEKCFDPNNTSQMIIDAVSAFQTKGLAEQIGIIHDNIHSFRKELIAYCQQENKGMTQ